MIVLLGVFPGFKGTDLFKGFYLSANIILQNLAGDVHQGVMVKMR